MRSAAVALMRDLDGEEVATACAMRRQDRAWQFIADFLGCSVQRVRDAVWEAESLGYQLKTEEMVRLCGAERVGPFLRQCADAIEVRR